MLWRQIKFILSPIWISLIILVVVFVYLCLTILAPWQLGKNTTTRKRNHQIETSLTAHPINFYQINNTVNDYDEWRKVKILGKFLPNEEFIVRLRTHAGKPSLEILTAFLTTKGNKIIINRGYIDTINVNAINNISQPPDHQITIIGRIRKAETISKKRNPIKVSGYWNVYSINPKQLGDLTHSTYWPAYLQLLPNQPGVINSIELPDLVYGPYLSYGLQWLAFGILAPLALAYFIRAEAKNQKNQPQISTSLSAPAQKLKDRYG